MTVFWYTAFILLTWLAIGWPIIALVEMRRRRKYREDMLKEVRLLRKDSEAILTAAKTVNDSLNTLSLQVAAAGVPVQQPALSEHARLQGLVAEYNKGCTGEPRTDEPELHPLPGST